MTFNFRNKFGYWDLAKIIFAIIVIIWSASQCSCLSAKQRQEKKCVKALAQLEKCPDLLRPDTIKIETITTIAGVTVTSTIYLQSICDSLKYWASNSVTGTKVLIDKKVNGVKNKVEIDKATGELKADCITDTLYIKRTVYVPMVKTTTWQDVNKFFNLQTKVFWYNIQGFIWWIVGVLVFLGVTYLVIKILNPL